MDLPQPLTPRELEVVSVLASGATDPEIASQLFVAVTTVKFHLKNARQKLGCRNRVQLATWALSRPGSSS